MTSHRVNRCCRNQSRVAKNCSKTIALFMMAALLILITPPKIVAASSRQLLRAGHERFGDVVVYLSNLAESAPLAGPRGLVLRVLARSAKGTRPSFTQGPRNRRGIKPPYKPETRAEKELRVSTLQINPSGNVRLQSRQPILFTAIPTDAEGNSIHGLAASWSSSNREVLFVWPNGQAIAGKPGRASLTASAGSITATVSVVVAPSSTREDFGGKKKANTSRHSVGYDLTQSEDKNNGNKRFGSTLEKKARARARLKHHESTDSSASFFQRPPNEDPLPDDETPSLYDPGNLVGSPPGKTKPGAQTPAVADGGTETNGNQNFTFALPIVGLNGRGLDASLSLVYNSQVWNKSTDTLNGDTWMTFDVDSAWTGPGFRLGLGQIEDQGGYGFTLTDADGTRHALVYQSANNYETNDGTFIHYTGGAGSGTLYYSDGTRVTYGAGGGGYRIYPTKITDRNGNYIVISYAGTNGAGPKISTIQDTLERYIHFYYASNGDLVTITAPGQGTTDLQMMRFYYTDVAIGSNLFDSSVNVSGPPNSTIHTLQCVYLPTSSASSTGHVGYKFEYSPYGMIRQITQFRGVTISSTSTSSAGSVTSDGTMAGQTTYSYPPTGQSLTDVPKYSTRSDEWAGRTTDGDAPAYTFANSSATGEKISTITAPDGTMTETHSTDNPSSWDDGLVKQTLVKYGSTTLSNTVIDWEQPTGGGPARVHSVRTTDDGSTARTKAIVFSYTSYNNVSAVSERQFTTNGSVSDTELRRTETSYLTSSNYVNRHLLHLPSSVQVFEGRATTPISKVDYAYDNYGTNHATLMARDDIIMHDPAFDPFQQTQETNCHWECWDWEYHDCYDWEWVCDYYNPYDATTDYRGNVTSVTTYPDASTTSGAISHDTTYDIAGNVITAEVDCCQLKSLTYSGGGTNEAHDYAYVISITSGNPSGLHLTRQASYHYNTGLISTTTDENSQVTTTTYDDETLRVDDVSYPDGGETSFDYGDELISDANGKYHFYAVASTKLDGSGSSTRYVDSYEFFDGRGFLARRFGGYTAANGWSTQDIQYDNMERAFRASNPYYAAYDPTSTNNAINPEGYWTTSTFDHLGRVTQVSMPRGDNDNSLNTNVQASYDGIYTTVTDQAQKLRRQKIDELGRVIQLDEPTTSGLGPVDSPYQPTSYAYDALNNVVHIQQGDQHRYFKYDSLSRLILERQVEQETNSNYNLSDSLTGNSAWSRKIEYNSSGLVTDAYDARGIHKHFSYDDLNRVTTITYSDSTAAAHYFYDNQTLPSGAPSYSHDNATGRLLAMTYGSSSSITGDYFAYDVMGRVKTQKQVTGSAVYGLNYTYNYGGMLTGETYPSTRALAYAYDDGGRLASVGDGTTTFANEFAYASQGGLSSEKWGNSAVHTISYNRRQQASQVKLTLGSNVLQQYDYGFGEFDPSTGATNTAKNNGQIGKITGTIGATPQWNQGFSYDELGRLLSVVEHSGSSNDNNAIDFSHSYTYDRYGNRFQSANTTLNLPAVTSSEIVTATNRFIASGSTPTTYDAAGNITIDQKFRNLKYEYDANGRQTAVKLLDNSTIQTSVYDCRGLRVQTTSNNMTRTMVYDVFGQNVADYLGSSGATLERENMYRGGQLLATDEHLNAAAPAALATTPSSSNVVLSWSAASGATKYRVERKEAGSSYSLLSTTTTDGYTDNGASSGRAYLYRVCAADNNGNCTSDYSNIALGARQSFTTDANLVGYAEDSANATTIKAAHITELRTAIDAVRSLAGQSAAGYTHSTITPQSSVVYADDVRELRSRLNDALVALNIQTSNYTDNTITSFAEDPLNATTLKAVHIRELRQRATNGTGNSSSGGSSGGLHYVLSDVQGTARTVMNSAGASSAVIARHDFLPFGEEIGAGLGSRTIGQAYNATDANRQKYGLMERDEATGLDYTWWRKYDSLSGRWTSPDPYRGSMTIGDAQSFNRYAYVKNDPVNFIDPLGLLSVILVPLPQTWTVTVTANWDDMTGILPDWTSSSLNLSWLFGPTLLAPPQNPQRPPKEPERIKEQPKTPRPETYKDCVAREWYLFNQNVEKVTAEANKNFEERKGPKWLDKTHGTLEKILTIIDLITGESGEFDPGDSGESLAELLNKQTRLDEIEKGTKDAAAKREDRIQKNCKKP